MLCFVLLKKKPFWVVHWTPSKSSCLLIPETPFSFSFAPIPVCFSLPFLLRNNDFFLFELYHTHVSRDCLISFLVFTSASVSLVSASLFNTSITNLFCDLYFCVQCHSRVHLYIVCHLFCLGRITVSLLITTLCNFCLFL